MGEKRTCGICGRPTSYTDGFCVRSKRCAAARSKARYDRVKGPFPLCLACGYPLRQRGGRFHNECRRQPRAVLLARLAAAMAQVQARREQAEREARRARWREQKAREQAARKAQEQAGAWSLADRERWLARERAGTPCPGCGRAIGRNGGCWRSAGCIDATMVLVMPNYDSRRLYSSAA